MVNTLVYHIASGQSFFSGVALIYLAVFMGLRGGGRRAAFVRTTSAVAGLLLIAVSATPLSRWFYLFAGAASLAWLGAEGSAARAARRSKTWLRLAILAAWGAGVALELPYHLAPRVPRMGDPTVFVVGDSVSAGMGGERQTWPRLLSQRHRVRVRDLSLAGASVATALREQAGQTTEPASLVLLEIGGNDILGETPPEAFERGLDALLKRLRGGRRTVVMLELPLPPFSNGYGEAQRRLAARHGAILVPKRVLLGVLVARGTTLDTIHLSRYGHGMMAEAMWRVIRGAFGGRKPGASSAGGPDNFRVVRGAQRQEAGDGATVRSSAPLVPIPLAAPPPGQLGSCPGHPGAVHGSLDTVLQPFQPAPVALLLLRDVISDPPGADRTDKSLLGYIYNPDVVAFLPIYQRVEIQVPVRG